MEPSRYQSALDVLGDLAHLIRAERTRRRLALREAAAEAGIYHSVLWRIERGDHVSQPHVIAAITWLRDSEEGQP